MSTEIGKQFSCTSGMSYVNSIDVNLFHSAYKLSRSRRLSGVSTILSLITGLPASHRKKLHVCVKFYSRCMRFSSKVCFSLKHKIGNSCNEVVTGSACLILCQHCTDFHWFVQVCSHPRTAEFLSMMCAALRLFTRFATFMINNWYMIVWVI